jgi:hypothetical protein
MTSKKQNDQIINQFKSAIAEASKKLKLSVKNTTDLLSKHTSILDFEYPRSNGDRTVTVDSDNVLLTTGVWLPYRDTNIRYMMLDKQYNLDGVICTRAIVEGTGHILKHTRNYREIVYVIAGEIYNPVDDKSYFEGEKIIIDFNGAREFIYKNAIAIVHWIPPLKDFNKSEFFRNLCFML